MDKAEKDFIIAQITQGKYFVESGGKQYIYIDPAPDIRLIIQFQQKMFEAHLLEEGFLSETEEEQLLMDRNIWTPEHEKKLKDFRENEQKLIRERPEFRFQSKKLERIDQLMEQTKNHVDKLLARKHTFTLQTAKYRANREVYAMLLLNGLHTMTHERVWDSLEEFEDDTNYSHIEDMINTVFYNGIFSENCLREVARSEPWRTVWKTSCKGATDIFGIPAGQYSMWQYLLCYWSQIYDYVFESPDGPKGEDVNDNEVIDNWLMLQAAEQEKKTLGETGPKINNNRIANAQEVFVMADTPEDAKKVYKELNSPSARRKIQQRQKWIQDKGSVKEQNLPDTKRMLQMEMNKAFASQVKGR
jgi:hypothetical protein